MGDYGLIKGLGRAVPLFVVGAVTRGILKLVVSTPALGHHRLFNQHFRTVSPFLMPTSSSASSMLTPSSFDTNFIASERDSSVYLAKFSIATILPVT
ncbi:hypothetical protein Scep_024738 [Stephania cephalantha]|uniref:Uncharacterized protein n=1 Tax=Stephania cephalantha TaxID=152367 RepID=A0AAP0HTZ5_9MAGN